MACNSDRFPIMLGITVADMQKSLAFWRDQLGFTLEESWPNEQAPMWASLVLDRQTMMLSLAMPKAACEQMFEKDPAAGRFWGEQAAKFAQGAHGVGVSMYYVVPDIDAFTAQIQKRGVTPKLPPTTQFYGLRNIVLVDPDGYVVTFYTPVAMTSCQSCGMPLTDAEPGEMFCHYCVDESGKLKPYETVFEGTVTGYFMAHQKMARPAAEKAAREHLKQMPAWSGKH